MRRYISLFLFPLVLWGCDDGAPHEPHDFIPPFPPVGITTISLDNAVEIRWIPNQEPDLDGYRVYFSDRYDGKYTLLGQTRKTAFVDQGAINGITYYYAVTAFDLAGNESELSRDVAYDTPRPEGRGVVLRDRFLDPFRSGYDFSAYRVTYYDSESTDFYLETSERGVPYLVVWKDTDVQDMGWTSSLDVISSAPEAGWSPTKDAVAIKGHTYVVWTYDNHFAKVRIVDVSPTSIIFDWAYQTAKGNPELFTSERMNLSKSAHRSRH